MAIKHLIWWIWHVCCLQLLASCQLVLSENSEESRKLLWQPTNLDNFLINNKTFFNYVGEWNTSILESVKDDKIVDDSYDEIENDKFKIDMYAEKVFKLSCNDSTMILTDLTNCLTNFNFYTCVRLLLLSRIKPLVVDLEKFNSSGIDFNLFQGLITLKWRNTTELKYISNNEPMLKFDASLSQELNSYVLRLFQSRSLQFNVFPGLGIEFTPKSVSDQNGLLCFSAKAFKEPNFNTTGLYVAAAVAEMRKKADKKKKKNKEGGFNMMPMMIVPQMIMLGMLPFALANLKMMVMNAFMMNSMALNSAIFMTIRNMVFGPKKGPKIKYVNYGYGKKKANKKPEIILHSPAAFVKKPLQAHHQNSPYSPNPNHSDNPNTYSYKRRNELNKHNEKKLQKLRIRNNNPDFIGETNLQNNYVHSYNAPNLDVIGEGTSGIDAPISYLNNNQYLKPSQQAYPPNNNRYDISLSSTTQQYSYESFNNADLQSYNDEEFHPKTGDDYGNSNTNSFNSQYNPLYNSNNKYLNHRVSRK